MPTPKDTPCERAISAYNEVVTLLRAKHYAAAQEQFEQALALDETLAGAERGEGGKYLIVPPGYNESLPEGGFFVARARTHPRRVVRPHLDR